MRARRGWSLIEVTVSIAITIVVSAIAAVLIVQGVVFSRRGQELADANDAARFAGEVVVAALQNAGVGMGGGLLVAAPSSTATNVNAVMATNGADGGADELWVIRPHRHVFLEACRDEGAGTIVQGTVDRTGFGAIVARCPIMQGTASVSGEGTGMLLAVSNMKQAALLTSPAFGAGDAGVTLTFAEASMRGFADDPVLGFRPGDWVYPIRVEHYFLAPSPAGASALMVEAGTLLPGKPFPAPNASQVRRMVQDGIEDFQLAVGVDATGSGNPDNITWQHGLGATFQAGVKSVRVSVVARSPRTIVSSDGRPQLSAEYAPMSVEDHVVREPKPDGHRRTLFQRRVELPNLSAGDL